MSFLSRTGFVRTLMATLTITLGIVAIVTALFVYLGSSWFITPARRGLEPRHHDLLASPADYGLTLQPIRVKTEDDFFLETILASRSKEPGRAEKTRRMLTRLSTHGVQPQSSPRGTIVLLHGRGGRKEDMLSIAQRFVAADYRCIVYDARAHGKSEGSFCTFGTREVGDLSAILNFYESHLENTDESLGPLGVFGNSLGASVVLQALSREPRIRAAVAVAPFAELPEIVISSGQKKIHPAVPEWLIHTSIKLGGWRAGFDPYSVSPLRDTVDTTVPLFLTHGTLDEVIPIEHSRRLYHASESPHKIWREVHSGYHYNVLAEGGDDLYEEMIHFYLKHAG